MFSGIPASKCDFHWHRSPSLGLYIPFLPWICCSDANDFQVAKDVNASRETLVDLFAHIKNFFRRLEIYTEVPPTMAMKRIIIEIMAEVLTILAIATKEIKRPAAGEFILVRFIDLDSHPISEISQEVNWEQRC
jgi:hypothetical protein